MEPRRHISTTIILLTLFVLVLSGVAVWHAWQDHRRAADVALANRVTDGLIRAGGLHALERGLTAAALAGESGRVAGLAERIAGLRQQGDEHWRQALAGAHALRARLPDESGLAVACQDAERAYADLLRARSLADACLAGNPCTLDTPAWLRVITRFIDRAARLDNAAFLAREPDAQIPQFNHAIKDWVWMASEYAGRERVTLAWHIAMGRPLSSEVRGELTALRGVVEYSLLRLGEFRQDRHADPRLLAAMAAMERIFLNDFEISRDEIYAAADTGAYPYDAAEWLRQATRAIDSLLAVAAAASRVADEGAERAMQASRLNLLRDGLVAVIAVAAALLAIGWTRRSANELCRQKELAEATLHSIGDAVIATGPDLRVDYLSPVAEEMTGWTSQEAHGRPLDEVFHTVDGLSREVGPGALAASLRDNRVVAVAGNTVLLSRRGHEYTIEKTAVPIRDRQGRVVGGVLVFYDVMQTRHGPHLLGYHASHDPVTGLINRREFERRLNEFCLRAHEHGERHALCCLDLDQFKVVNETCGHAAGDQLLRQVAGRLAAHLRQSDILARLGGDEFGLLLADCPPERALSLAEQMRDDIGQARFEWDGKEFEPHASLGLVAIGPDSPPPADLLAQADAACHVAKQKGRNRVQAYEPGDLDMARRHGEMQWIARLTRALDEDRFELHCQTIVPLRGGARHYEVLVRYRAGDGRLVGPAEFIPAAERYDLMPAIDRWVIRHALAALAAHRQAGGGAGICGLNVSGASLGDEDFEPFLRGQFAEHGIPPGAVCLEITETAAVANLAQAAALIRSLRADGYRFALDDFGSGLSSFMYLKSLPVDYLKMDGSFVRAMPDSPLARATVQAIHSVARAVGIATIAEYAEDEIILAMLADLGIDYAQGYGVDRPRPMADYYRVAELEVPAAPNPQMPSAT